MEELFLLIQQVYRVLNILSNYSPKEREELLEGYHLFLSEIETIVIALNRIVEGSTSWGWKIDWGSLPWQLKNLSTAKRINLTSRLGR